MTSAFVSTEIREGVAILTLAAPSGDNLLGTVLVHDLARGLAAATADRSCRAIVLRAAGAHFCRGVDLSDAIRDGRPDAALLGAIAGCFGRIATAPQPVIAFVEGHATGGGVGLAAACDVVIASQEVSFTMSEAIAGMIPALIAPILLRRMAPGRVRYMALSTRAIPATEARDFGLVDLSVPAAQADGALRHQLQRILRSSPQALAETKRYLDGLASPGLAAQLDAGLARLLAWLGDDAVADGVRRFASGEAPPWFQRYAEGRRA